MKLVILFLAICALAVHCQEFSWVQCAKDAVQLAADVKQLVADAQAQKMAVVIQDLQKILADINSLKKDCGISLSELLLSEGDWVQCLQDVAQIVQLTQQIQDDIKHFNIIKLTQDVNSLYQTVMKALDDCQASTEPVNTDWIQCAKDAVQLAADVKQLVADAQAQKMAAVIQDLQTILADINSLKKDCGISLSELLLSEGDWVQCLQDVAQIAQLTQQIQDDIKHFNIIKLTQDVNSLYQTVQKALDDCQ